MLKACLGVGAQSGGLARAEVMAVDRLAMAHGQLLVVDGQVECESQFGSRTCDTFLRALEEAVRVLGVARADRSYRLEFSLNYRNLFPVYAKLYAVPVLEAFMQRHAAVWVNGTRYALSYESMQLADATCKAWHHLGEFLHTWRMGFNCSGSAAAVARRKRLEGKFELKDVLCDLDTAWATFERCHVEELSRIEAKAREPLLKALSCQQQLDDLELRHGLRVETPAYREAQCELVGWISRLNVSANSTRKGRDDLGIDALDAAQRVLKQCWVGFLGEDYRDGRRAAKVLAKHIVDSFEAMRNYLRSIANQPIEYVDPQLCNNAALVARLVDWEESWEVGSHYLLDAHRLGAICSLVAELVAVQRMSPAFAEMCETCDVELFLVLPRLVWLCFLSDLARYRGLMRNLLPQLFVQSNNGIVEELRKFRQHFYTVQEAVEQHCAAEALGKPAPEAGPKAAAGKRGAAWSVLVTRAVSGFVEGAAADEPPASGLSDFMLSLERRSIEMQRHCPQDWNQCSAVVVQCLAEADDTDDEGEDGRTSTSASGGSGSGCSERRC